MRTWVVALCAGAAGISLGVAGTIAFQTIPTQTHDSRIEDAANDCHLANKFYATLADDGSSLTIDAQGKESGGARYDEIECVFLALDAPQDVVSHFGQTTAMDGRQEETWDGIQLSWSYHPDRGPDCIFRLNAR